MRNPETSSGLQPIELRRKLVECIRGGAQSAWDDYLRWSDWTILESGVEGFVSAEICRSLFSGLNVGASNHRFGVSLETNFSDISRHLRSSVTTAIESDGSRYDLVVWSHRDQEYPCAAIELKRECSDGDILEDLRKGAHFLRSFKVLNSVADCFIVACIGKRITVDRLEVIKRRFTSEHPYEVETWGSFEILRGGGAALGGFLLA